MWAFLLWTIPNSKFNWKSQIIIIDCLSICIDLPVGIQFQNESSHFNICESCPQYERWTDNHSVVRWNILPWWFDPNLFPFIIPVVHQPMWPAIIDAKKRQPHLVSSSKNNPKPSLERHGRGASGGVSLRNQLWKLFCWHFILCHFLKLKENLNDFDGF